ncbi:MAG: TRAP transporter small permease [Desulfovermiculus sp.]|nr:TRAP transporter small permease [Desulfovermiculus sp.]
MPGNFMQRLDGAINGFSTTVMTVCMTVATITAFMNVVLRYIFKMSVPWAAVLTSYLFIWSALFGAAYGFKIGMHIGVTVVIQNLPPKWAKIMLTINLVIMVVFLSVLTWWGLQFIHFSINLQQIDIDLRIPFWTIYLCVPIAMGIAVYQLLRKLYLVLTIPTSEFSYDAVMKESA